MADEKRSPSEDSSKAGVHHTEALGGVQAAAKDE